MKSHRLNRLFNAKSGPSFDVVIDHYCMPMMVEPLVFRPNSVAGGYMVDCDLVKIQHLVRQAVELGLMLINLAEESEYCEKLMYARENMKTPAHTHRKKKEDIIARRGTLRLQLWPGTPRESEGIVFEERVNGTSCRLTGGEFLDLKAGERITLVPGIYHEFFPVYGPCIIGEVSTANDDLNDNFFINPDVWRFPGIEEDEASFLRLIGEKNS